MTKDRKRADPGKAMLLSDLGQLPGFNVEDYNDLLRPARRRFDRLCSFTTGKCEESIDGVAKHVDWEGRRRHAIAALDRWERESFAISVALVKIVQHARDSRVLLQLRSAEHQAKCEARIKRKSSDLRKLKEHERSGRKA
jgi:hypothetical protein